MNAPSRFDKMRANRRRRAGAEDGARKQLMLALIDELEREEVTTWAKPSAPEPDPFMVPELPPRRLFGWLRR